jgi:hypothetical protein
MRRTFSEAVEQAHIIASNQFPENEWHLNITKFADGDYTINIDHSFDRSEDGNTIRDRITLKPESSHREIIEVIDTHAHKVISIREFDDRKI